MSLIPGASGSPANLIDGTIQHTAFYGTIPEPGGASPYQLATTHRRKQVIDPTADIEVRLPSAGFIQGDSISIINRSPTYTITVKTYNGTATVLSVLPNTESTFVAMVGAPVNVGDWDTSLVRHTNTVDVPFSVVKAADNTGIKFQASGSTTELGKTTDAGAWTLGPSAVIVNPLTVNSSGISGGNFLTSSGAYGGSIGSLYNIGGMIIAQNAYATSVASDSWAARTGGAGIRSNAIYMGTNSTSNAFEFRHSADNPSTSGAAFATLFSNLFASCTTTGAWTLGPSGGGQIHSLLCDQLKIRYNTSSEGFIFDLPGAAPGYSTTFSMDGTGLAIRGDSASRDIRIKPNGVEALTCATTGAVTLGPRTDNNLTHVINGKYLAIQAGESYNSAYVVFRDGTAQMGAVGASTGNSFALYNAADAAVTTCDQNGAWMLGPSSGTDTVLHSIKGYNTGSRACVIENRGGSAPSVLSLDLSGASPDNNSTYFLRCVDTTTTRCYIYTDGDVWTSDAGTLTSDERLKTNIQPATPKLADVMRLQVKNFEWIPEYHPEKVGDKKIGFIAQEFEQVFPGLVNEHTLELQGEEVTRKSIRYGALIPILTKAIQEQQTIIEALEARLAVLEAK